MLKNTNNKNMNTKHGSYRSCARQYRVTYYSILQPACVLQPPNLYVLRSVSKGTQRKAYVSLRDNHLSELTLGFCSGN